jgi:hypothetical protein
MSELATDATRTERFNDVARAFTAPLPRRQAKLMPFREGIFELRQKGASLGLIRELLATIGVSASKATIARFLVEVADPSRPTRPRPRSNHGRGFVPNTDRSQPVAVPSAKPSVTSSPSATPVRTAEPSGERPRTRGPRVADPRNL